MAADDSYRLEEDFIEAKNSWELEKLYVDLASAKGKALTPVEKKFLRGLLCGCSPAEIAKVVYQSGSSSTVRVYLSNGLYKYIEEMLSNQVGDSVKVKTWSRVTQLLEKAGYKKGWFHLQPVINPIIVNKDMELDLLSHKSILNNGNELIHTNIFHGRRQELAQVQEWILQERCRLVVILGMAGIGKTAFSVKLTAEIQPQFEHVIWRSLRFAPPLEVFLDQLIQQLSPPTSPTTLPGIIDNKIAQLIDCLRSRRCLLVLDRLDSILADSDRHQTINTPMSNQISYRQGYEGYGELISYIGDLEHQSCVVLTSREKTQELAALEGIQLPVRCLKLNGLNQQESIFLLKNKGLLHKSSQSDYQILIEQYAGNPLFLKLIATTIQELFAGNIAEFIALETRIFGDIRTTIEQQFQRLSHVEKQLLYWLSLQPNCQSIKELEKNLLLPGLSPLMSQRLILEAMEFLQRRSLLDRQASGFSLSPVLREYILERLTEENAQLHQDKNSHLLLSNPMFAAHLKQYLKDENR
ncbi:NACHT domain-containing protein [Tolypothrix sp. FACHB-123]|uniref:NB-ARC domain-containing protein n=1 Tax=Tolypothrix sp. FACHB-123 TaxID=2692868 RepID=UPI0016862F56|nr:NB-ARC domain-containing protein [Tolypothrix sp. FACHB-123]MBD2353419.1 NACHT domain-containing protein [Tolypothrix sp. FACHB-123]